MALHPIEEATIRAFVVPSKRDRWLALFGSSKRRKQARAALNHFADWDPRYMQELGSSANVLVHLCEAGAPLGCHIVSDNPALDGRDLPLAEAVAAVEAYSFASVLCRLPGQLACFFDEMAAPRTRILLRRPRGNSTIATEDRPGK
ncbi:MAG TPA: hypothetical protein VGM86_21990 [Thermoanaerobaculia bacterium]|jgi:hypothetical protein